MRIGRACTFLLAAFCVVTAADLDSFTISGKIVERGSGKPLAKVMMLLTPVNQQGRDISYISAADGQFTFQNLAAGKYRLIANRRGFFPQALDDDQQGYSTAVALDPDIDSEPILFPFRVGGSISLHVVDEDGEPVRQAEALLFRKGITLGKSAISLHSTGFTDSSGDASFLHLQPGTYFLGVKAHPWYAQNSSIPAQSSSNLDVTYPVTYYSDTTEAASASPITVADRSSTKIEVALRAVPAMHVDLSFPALPANTSFNGSASVIGPGGVPIVASGFGGNDHLSISGLAPGNYVISLQETQDHGPGGYANISPNVNGNQSLAIARCSKLRCQDT